MTLIALEEHMLPADLVDQVRPGATEPDALTAKLADVGEQRLRVMDEAGIDMQVLSVTAPGSQQVPAEHAEGLSQAINDRCAEAVAAHSDRFNALATLPTQDPGAAIVEAKRAVTELGFCGVVINGHTQGRFLGAPEFDELLAAIEELDVPVVYLHPTYPLPLSVFGDTFMRRPLAGFGFWSLRFGPHVGGVLQKLRRHRMSRCPRHGLYQPMWLARVPMGPWS